MPETNTPNNNVTHVDFKEGVILNGPQNERPVVDGLSLNPTIVEDHNFQDPDDYKDPIQHEEIMESLIYYDEDSDGHLKLVEPAARFQKIRDILKSGDEYFKLGFNRKRTIGTALAILAVVASAELHNLEFTPQKTKQNQEHISTENQK